MTSPPGARLYPYAHHPDQDRGTPARHPVTIVGAGPVGLALAIDLAQHGTQVLLLDENTGISEGSRAICFSKRTLEVADRLGAGQPLVDLGVQWSIGRVFAGAREIYRFDLLPEDGHRRPAFINLQQYHFERTLLARARRLQAEGAPLDLRGGNRVTGVRPAATGARLTIETPDGPFELDTDWLVACDGARSPLRRMLGLGFAGRVFQDNFLIADVTMQAAFPTERRFWFDPPFNPGRSALLHKQPDGVWRIDLQLGRDIDRSAETDPGRVRARVARMLGPGTAFDLEWVSIYTFQCRRMQNFRHGRVIFAGDAAHQVSPFGARGANSGIQDADNLGWKLAAVVAGAAPRSLLDSYATEREQAADENIAASTRSTDFITPASDASRIFRDAVLHLSRRHGFARPFVNSGRLSLPSVHDGSPLNTPDALPGGPDRTRPGAPCPDAPCPEAPLDDGFLLDRLGGHFTLLALGTTAPAGTGIATLAPRMTEPLRARYLGRADRALYLVRPDQHVAARWRDATAADITAALARATGQTP